MHIILALFSLLFLHCFGLKESYRIGVVVDVVTTDENTTVLVTNETVMSIFQAAVTEQNLAAATVSFKNFTLPQNNETKATFATTLLPAGDLVEMLRKLDSETEKAKGELLALVDIGRCVVRKCQDLDEVLEKWPHALLFSPCCYAMRPTFQNQTFKTLYGKGQRKVYNGLDPSGIANTALLLSTTYKWRYFNFVLSSDWPMIDAFYDETKRLTSQSIRFTKTFYCTELLAQRIHCNRNNQATRLILNKATVTFFLLENPTDMIDFAKEADKGVRQKSFQDEGKVFIYVSLTGMLIPIFMLPDLSLLAYAPEGLMILRQKKPLFSNYRFFANYGIGNSDIASELFTQFRIVSKAIEVFAENRKLFGSLGNIFCGSTFSFAESPEATVEFSDDCTHAVAPAEVWNGKRRKDGKPYVEEVFELQNATNFNRTGQPFWFLSGTVAPVENECKLEGGGFCPIDLGVIIGPSFSGSVVFIVLTVLTGCCIYGSNRKRKQRRQKIIDSVIAHFSDVTFVRQTDEDRREAISRLDSHASSVVESVEPGMENQETLRPGDRLAGKWRDENVVVTLLHRPFIIVDNILLQEILQVKALRHPNVNPLIAVTTDPSHSCTLHEYCAKGSLSQVLARKTLQLNRLFKVSFLNDIAAGMAYLHQSSIRSHGELTSENILVDARWFCKISHIPMTTSRVANQEDVNASITNNRHLAVMLKNIPSLAQLKASSYSVPPEGTYWTAPELLRLSEDVRPLRGSQKGDVYSYGIVIFEVATRKRPYFYDSLTEKELLSKVRISSYPPFRPNCPISNIPGDVTDLLDIARRCWEEVSAFRPTFTAIVRALQKTNNAKDVSAKLVDEMIATMENYAVNLEATVSARTNELAEEQRRCEDLLSKMLPRSIIEELKSGRIVHPESFESVTVYFSDIVGFTKLAAESAALEVVNLLNDLYSEFDNVIDLYNVYKVETVGDAYMVASGLPIRNTIHAAEIATMALDIMSRVTTFQIRHRPGKVLQLRIGIHSGPVVAGIVGLTMPRYCLFGDTVNYASRMESSGLALRIHVSPESKTLLDKIGGYQLEKRGFVTMKGKGSIQTYHLIGKDGFTRPLPDLSLACSLAEHEFK